MSDAEDEGQEKSHEPTERRLDEARRKGDVARSMDAQSALAYVGLFAALAVGGSAGAEAVGEVLATALARPAMLAAGAMDGGGGAFVAGLAGRLFAAIWPLLLAPAALILAYLAVTRGIVFAPGKISPKLSRISPIENAKNKYGIRGLVEFAKSTLKLMLLLGVLTLVLYRLSDDLVQSVHVEARLMGGLLAGQLNAMLTGTLVVAAILGLADFFWQRHSHRKQLRMTYEDLRKEQKESEGDPYMRANRRERAKAIATNRMLEAVPDAKVVITNPIHFAVALAWDREAGTAPRCVAKGVDEMALIIRERAEAAGVPVHEDPATARALHAGVEIGQDIPPEQYRAVAAAILFADEMRRKATERG
ncbi:MAG: flagellar type III secretion system protein FlhB [Pseudomonadota bacterium]